MINYNTQSMHTVAKTIQGNGQELQSDLQNLWSFYQTDSHGTLAALASCLSSFMDRCKSASLALAQNRIDIGNTLDQAATAAEQTETKLRTSFRGHMMPQ